ncbi:uncharacterized protein LOC101155258 isoform X3 [Oryzias latipes]|uniref:uncharacterized protein LOC101155258 isoform X3 n=1 Tax=Oryzias latipes TaxID=8090 RepID=UPI000CE202EF|nr:uncharacterized protein LOC101155258 isoform X3 [Oryzias latipes]
MSSEPQEGSVREQLSVAEGTLVQNEEELCRQRRLLDSSWNPQLQLHIAVLPQHWVTDEDLCNQQRNFRVKHEEPEPLQTKEELDELCISQHEDQLDLKQEADTLMEIPTYEEDENSEADLNNQQSFNATDSQDEEGNQHEESTSTIDEETDPQNRDQRKRRDKRHVHSVDSSHRCKRQCLEAFTVTAKETILENFNTIGTQDAQDAHLMSLISCKKPQRRRPRGAGESQERKWQYHYKVKLGDEEKVVCREAFASLHGIGTKRVRRVANHQSQGITPKDKRGTHNNRRCISDDLKGKVDEHIRSFPYFVSHYECHGTKRRYLASDLTVVKMYSLFLQLFYPEKYADYLTGKDVKKIDCEVKFWFYYDYFKMHFNYGFGRPRSDVCSVCSEYQAKLKVEKNAAVWNTL